MSNENEFVASVNRLENRIDSSQQELKRDVELLMTNLINLQSGIDRRYGSLKEELNSFKSSQSALDQINNGLALLVAQDNRLVLGDLPSRIRDILSTITSRLHSNDHTTTSTLELDSSEIGDKDTAETANLGGNELGTEEQANGLDTNVPSTSTANDGNVNESMSGNEQVSRNTPNLSSVSTTIDTDQSTNETSMQQSNETTLDSSKMLWWDSYMEVYMEDEDDYHQIDVPEGAQEGSDNEYESLRDEANGINKSFENDNQIDQQTNKDDQNESNSTINVDHNESPTSEQSNTRKRRRAGISLATECSSLENSLPSSEVSTSGSMTMSKRVRVSSTLNRRESAEQVNTQSGVDLSDEDDPNGGEIDSSEEEGVEQNEDGESWWDNEIELGDEEKGHYRIEIVTLKCIEDGCNAELASRDELHRHLRNEHNTSSPYRCLARGCLERGWDGLGIHVRDNHSNISTWQCPHCTKTFKSQKLLYTHLHFYHFEGQFKCGYDGCRYDRVATLRSEIKSHQYSVHPNSTIFTCQFNNCGKSFKLKGDFNRHQRIHTGVKPFRCGWTGCVKSFTLKGDLNNHQRIHQKLKPYKCTWNQCGYAATQLGNVITHIRMKHFFLPRTQTEQRQRGIKDNRDPRDYFLNTTHQSDHNSTDSDDSDH